MRTILILIDSFNRRYSSLYGNDWVAMPNMERIAARSTVFTRYFTASAPCMPARHDILTGRMEFLERNWSAIQPYDTTLTEVFREHGQFSHMVTDHYHYFHVGGENYASIFDSWEFIRGQEHDIWKSNLPPKAPRPHLGQDHSQYRKNRAAFGDEAGFPVAKTFGEASTWLDGHHKDDNWLLFIDSFDPHEPFDLPDETPTLYGDDWKGEPYTWPEYAPVNVPPAAIDHLRKQYASVLTMTDRWLGKLVDRLDRYGMWEDTAVIVTTDHGFMLGEHGFTAKNYMPAYNELYHIPLVIHTPGQKERAETGALSQAVDLFPTILELHGIDPAGLPSPLHGHSLLPVLRGECSQVREYALYGIFGKQVNIFDGRYTYFRAACREDNLPLSIYTAVPTTIFHYWDRKHLEDFTGIEMGRYLSWTDYPVYRFPASLTKLQDPSHRFDMRPEVLEKSMLFDLDNDYAQNHDLAGSLPEVESRLCALLSRALAEHDSPPEQYERLGLVRESQN